MNSSADHNLKAYLTDSRLAQIATVSGEKPWICTVYYVIDDEYNLYWLSYPGRKHSEDIALNNEVAIAIAVKQERPVIGIQIIGRVETVQDKKVVKTMIDTYIDKYGEGREFYPNFIHVKNKHVMYKCTPQKVYVFDETNYTDGERHEIVI